MQVDIQAHKFSLTQALKHYVKGRLDHTLTFCGSHVQRIVIRLSDINGPRGGKDKCCLLQIKLAGLPDVIVKDTETDLYAAIDRAVDRATQAVVRKIGRQQSLNKHSRLSAEDMERMAAT